MPQQDSNEDLIQAADACHGRASAAQRELFSLILEIDLTGAWEHSGARDLAHWLVMRYGISYWKALRWIGAAHALRELPLLSEAFASGRLGIDKVVELCRFASLQTESRLITWAQGVSVGAVRHKGDLARQSLREAQEAHTTRRVEWWYYSDNSRFGLSAELPAHHGAVVVRALERLADQMPVMPGEEEDHNADARRADALVALCSARIAEDPDPDRATVVIHARVDRTEERPALTSRAGSPSARSREARPSIPRWPGGYCARPGSRRFWRMHPASRSGWEGSGGSLRSG